MAIFVTIEISTVNCVCLFYCVYGEANLREWFENKLGKISRKLVKHEVLPYPNVISVC